MNIYSFISRIFLFLSVIFLCGMICPLSLEAKDKKSEDEKDSKCIASDKLGGLKWRSIGPAMTSGRIADFAVNPQEP